MGMDPAHFQAMAERVAAARSRRFNDNNLKSEVSDTKSQCDTPPALGTMATGEAESISRVTVRFVGYRTTPLDPDNFAGSVKDLLDGLRASKLIRDDSPEHIVLETSQVKVKHRADEYTEITIEPI